ncbi:MAG: M23 family metallopeptidase [Chryseobacterium sp.]|nr:MAG: M23 family metallopeptidase [Chryseobacterium sp.]
MIRLFHLGIALLLFPKAEVSAQDLPAVYLPLQKLSITSSFGMRIHPVTGKTDFHRGIDLAADCDPVLNIMDGKVKSIGFDPILGNYVRIQHGEFLSIYGHLSHILVTNGETVGAGYIIGVTGATGRVTGEHLHFSIRYRGRYLNPLLFLKSLLVPTPGLHY